MKQTLLLLFLSILLGTSLYAQSGPLSGDPGERPADERILVYPNPAVDYISLSGTTDAVDEIIIYSMVGRAVLRYKVLPGDRYAVGDLPNGMYLVQLVDDYDKILYTHRMNKSSLN